MVSIGFLYHCASSRNTGREVGDQITRVSLFLIGKKQDNWGAFIDPSFIPTKVLQLQNIFLSLVFSQLHVLGCAFLPNMKIEKARDYAMI